MPTILVKCANRDKTAAVFHYHQTCIAQICLVTLNCIVIWAISVSTFPLVASMLLIIISFSVLSNTNSHSNKCLTGLKTYQSLIRIDRQLSELGLQLITKDGQVLRLMRHQFNGDEYKKFNAVLDEGESNLSICIINQDKK